MAINTCRKRNAAARVAAAYFAYHEVSLFFWFSLISNLLPFLFKIITQPILYSIITAAYIMLPFPWMATFSISLITENSCATTWINSWAWAPSFIVWLF